MFLTTDNAIHRMVKISTALLVMEINIMNIYMKFKGHCTSRKRATFFPECQHLSLPH